ncbi:hypothetical protein CDD83_10888 [Cordyceps sp. RAO-2017]|nr:hypothetical protein CDD83_10888 [Cordyceps sp. RAO-2017]
MPNFFRGRPVFSNAGFAPPALGLVAGVLGKRQAKMQIADQVLQWLEAEAKRKDDIFRSLEGVTEPTVLG